MTFTPFRAAWFHSILAATTAATPPLVRVAAGLHAVKCHRHHQKADQHIVSGERNAKEAPRRLVAANDIDRLQLIEDRAAAVEVVQRSGAGRRAGPEMPLDAGVIDAERGAAQRDDRNCDEADAENLLRRLRQ